MSSVLLHMHPGLGDHFSTHGIVREYAKKFGKVGVFSKPHNYASVSYMFRDLPNVRVISAQTDEDAEAYIRRNMFNLGWGYDRVKVIGFERFAWGSPVQYERQFYALAGVPFEKKWESFFIARDADRESKILDLIPARDFIFIHDDTRYPVNPLNVMSSLPVFRPQKGATDNVCDYLGAIERAAEIHVIDSSFMFLIDCMAYHNPGQKLFVHRYARPNPEAMLPVLKKDWKIIE